MPRTIQTPEPEWYSNDPAQWDTYYEAWYQVVGAEPVCVDQYVKTASAAQIKADEALKEVLKKVIEIGIKVEASVWVVKWRTRTQKQVFDPTDEKEYLVTDWYGRLAQVSKSVYESEVNSRGRQS